MSIVGGSGNDVFNYQGTLMHLIMVLTNPYTGKSYNVDEEMRVNTIEYDGGGGYNTLLMGSSNDYVSLTHYVGIQMIRNIQMFSAGQGGDIINLAHEEIEYGDVTIIGGQGNDILWANIGNDYISGGDGDDIIDGGPGNDELHGGNGNDFITGGRGDDLIYGGDGDDILFGGLDLGLIELGKEFVDGMTFPDLVEGVNIMDLMPPGEPSLGVSGDNLSVDFAAPATITFREGFAGYNNTLGVYRIGADGVIEHASILWGNVKDAGYGTAYSLDLPVGADGGDFGFFIISDGYSANGGYADLPDLTGAGNIRFVYDLGGADERPATVHDNGGLVSVVYDDGTVVKVLQGPDYHTTPRDGGNSINDDGHTHVVSGVVEEGNVSYLRIGFEDLPNLGDADFEDVMFDLHIHKVLIDNSEPGNDILFGGNGNDIIFGEAGDDVLIGGAGHDQLYGGSGSDMFVFDALGLGVDTVHDFEYGAGGDILNITDLLEGYDPLADAIADFVRLTASGNDMEFYVDATGQSGAFELAFIVKNGANLVLADLIDSGNLVADQSFVL